MAKGELSPCSWAFRDDVGIVPYKWAQGNYFKIAGLTAFKYVNISNFLKYLYEFTARSPRRRMLRLLDAHNIHIFACSAAAPPPKKRLVQPSVFWEPYCPVGKV